MFYVGMRTTQNLLHPVASLLGSNGAISVNRFTFFPLLPSFIVNKKQKSKLVATNLLGTTTGIKVKRLWASSIFSRSLSDP